MIMPRKPMNKAKYAGGRDITEPDYYDHWADLHKIQDSIKLLKKDLERDSIPYYKYDELCDRISSMQIMVKQKDKIKNG